ncbi:MAG: hypothetical protein ACMG55_16680 [Microcoleus sp.]
MSIARSSSGFDVQQISMRKLQVVRSELRTPHNLGTIQGERKNLPASPRLELFAASNFRVFFKLDR